MQTAAGHGIGIWQLRRQLGRRDPAGGIYRRGTYGHSKEGTAGTLWRRVGVFHCWVMSFGVEIEYLVYVYMRVFNDLKAGADSGHDNPNPNLILFWGFLDGATGRWVRFVQICMYVHI